MRWPCFPTLPSAKSGRPASRISKLLGQGVAALRVRRRLGQVVRAGGHRAMAALRSSVGFVSWIGPPHFWGRRARTTSKRTPRRNVHGGTPSRLMSAEQRVGHVTARHASAPSGSSGRSRARDRQAHQWVHQTACNTVRKHRAIGDPGGQRKGRPWSTRTTHHRRTCERKDSRGKRGRYAPEAVSAGRPPRRLVLAPSRPRLHCSRVPVPAGTPKQRRWRQDRRPSTRRRRRRRRRARTAPQPPRNAQTNQV